jgi:AraC-like DNA-binding protein
MTRKKAYTRRDALPAADREVFEDLFGAPIRTGADRARLVVPASLLAMRVSSADPELAAYFEGVLGRAASIDPEDSPLLCRVREAIQRSLATGTPTAAAIGRHVAMSQRTLQRRLQEEGVSFADVLADTRRRLAFGYLADPTLNLAEVARLLGYREETSLFRAFRRWSGMSPSAWRMRPDAPTA